MNPVVAAEKLFGLRKLLNQDKQVVQQGLFETLVAIRSAVPKSHLNREYGSNRSAKPGRC